MTKGLLTRSRLAVLALLFSGAAHASLVDYDFTSKVAHAPVAINGFKPQLNDVASGSFSYFAPDTGTLTPASVIEGANSTAYIYQMPSEAYIDFTLDGHHFTSSSVSVVVSKPPSVKLGMPDSVALVGLGLKMDGVAIQNGMVGLEFAFPFGTVSGGQPLSTLSLNPSSYTVGYIVQNGDYGASGYFRTAGAASTTYAIFRPETLTAPAIPEPGTALLMLMGFGAIAVRAAAPSRRRTELSA
jgi:hypothetical protein